MDDALAVDGHCGAAVIGRLRSVHTVITTRTVAGFTDALIHCAVNWPVMSVPLVLPS
jgi:hypothetical protein